LQSRVPAMIPTLRGSATPMLGPPWMSAWLGATALRAEEHRGRLRHVGGVAAFSASLAPGLAGGAAFASAYIVAACCYYCSRHGAFSNQSARAIFIGKFLRPKEMSHGAFLLACTGWLGFLLLYPLAEPLAALLGYSLFYFYYPNADGAGLIFQPRKTSWSLGRSPLSENIRLDWHRFNINVGAPLPTGGFAPPKRQLNLPHINSAARRLRTWPWRQHPWLLGPFREQSPSEWVAAKWQACLIAGSQTWQRSAARSSVSATIVRTFPSALPEVEVASDLPKLQLSGERVIMVDGASGAAEISAAANRAFAVLANGGSLRVAMDAEWGPGQQPLALLQLAVEVGGTSDTCVFLIAMLAKPSFATLDVCRRFLLPRSTSPASRHHVLVFSPRNDLQRMIASGVLPQFCSGSHPQQLGWTDVQRLDQGLGPQPGLRKVVREVLGADLDKRMQTSNWNVRPLTQQQLDYAALDAACLLRVCR